MHPLAGMPDLDDHHDFASVLGGHDDVLNAEGDDDDDERYTIAETVESVAIIHKETAKKSTPSLPVWKEILIVLAVLIVPLLAFLTTWLINHYLPDLLSKR